VWGAGSCHPAAKVTFEILRRRGGPKHWPSVTQTILRRSSPAEPASDRSAPRGHFVPAAPDDRNGTTRRFHDAGVSFEKGTDERSVFTHELRMIGTTPVVIVEPLRWSRFHEASSTILTEHGPRPAGWTISNKGKVGLAGVRHGKADMMFKERFVVIGYAIDVVLRHLEGLPPSDNAEQLRVWVHECLREAEQWSASPPTPREREVLSKRLLALHVEVSKLERDALLDPGTSSVTARKVSALRGTLF
jgi:hypothetical protein